MTTRNNIGRELIPFKISNLSGSDKVYLYMFGTTDGASPQNNTYFLFDFNGNCTKFPPNQKQRSYGLALTGGETHAQFPQLDGVRVYISLENQLLIDTDKHGIPIAVSADNPAPGNPNYRIKWDFVEATWHDYKDHTILHVNTTQVDAFGLAFEVEHGGKDPSSPDKPLKIINGFDDGQGFPRRQSILHDLSAKSSPWADLIVYDQGLNMVRALAPIKALDQGKFPKDWLDKSISDIPRLYPDSAGGHYMHFTHENIQYWGAANPSQNHFFFQNADVTKRYLIPFPTTRECLANDIKVEPDDNTGKALAAAFCATILRGTLWKSNLVPVPQEQRSQYYTTDPRPFEYAQIIHKYGINNHAFCFGYDEVAGDAGKNRDVRDPEYFSLTIQDARIGS
jgi:hypothetical protein